jgi:hypothetical protein
MTNKKFKEMSDLELDQEITDLKHSIFFIMAITAIITVIMLVPSILTGNPFPEAMGFLALLLTAVNTMLLFYFHAQIEKRIRDAVKNGIC